MISGIHHASFTVSDMERSVAFYRDILGMRVVWDSAHAGVAFKGEVCDRLTNCPGKELRIVFLSVNDKLVELVQYTPKGNPTSDSLPVTPAALMSVSRRKISKVSTRS